MFLAFFIGGGVGGELGETFCEGKEKGRRIMEVEEGVPLCTSLPMTMVKGIPL